MLSGEDKVDPLTETKQEPREMDTPFLVLFITWLLGWRLLYVFVCPTTNLMELNKNLVLKVQLKVLPLKTCPDC